jgi:hypothetical protein
MVVTLHKVMMITFALLSTSKGHNPGATLSARIALRPHPLLPPSRFQIDIDIFFVPSVMLLGSIGYKKIVIKKPKAMLLDMICMLINCFFNKKLNDMLLSTRRVST